MNEVFAKSEMYLGFIPLYPAGMWSFAFASKGIDVQSEEVLIRIEKGMSEFGDSLKYYNKAVHQGAFALPGFVNDVLE